MQLAEIERDVFSSDERNLLLNEFGWASLRISEITMRRRLVAVLFVLLFLADGSFGELRLLQIVYNSGHRPPDRTPVRDPYRFWQTGPGRLAMIGMIQLFRLGQTMRRKYSDFVTDQPSEVDLYPSERGTPCSSLSQCFVSGFYKPNKDHPPPKDPAWQPQNSIPDKPTEPNLKCPKLQDATSRLYDDSEEGNRIIEQYMNLYQFWSDNSGMQIRNPTDARELYENLQLEKGLNMSLPSWADRFWPELKQQSEIHFTWLAKNQNMQRMAAGPLLGLIIQRMHRHIDGYDIQKYFVYSGKNSSLAGLLAIFGAFDGVEPSFGSTIVLELHKFGAIYYVRVLYFYSSDPHTEIPEIITLRGCSEYCPFDKFRLLTTGMVPLKWEQECGLRESGSSSAKLVCAAALVWLMFFIL